MPPCQKEQSQSIKFKTVIRKDKDNFEEKKLAEVMPQNNIFFFKKIISKSLKGQ